MADGSRFTDKAGWETMEFKQQCTGRDPRLAQTIRTPGYMRIGAATKLAPDLSVTVTGYQPVKFVTGTAQDAYNKSVRRRFTSTTPKPRPNWRSSPRRTSIFRSSDCATAWGCPI